MGNGKIHERSNGIVSATSDTYYQFGRWDAGKHLGGGMVVRFGSLSLIILGENMDSTIAMKEIKIVIDEEKLEELMLCWMKWACAATRSSSQLVVSVRAGRGARRYFF